MHVSDSREEIMLAPELAALLVVMAFVLLVFAVLVTYRAHCEVNRRVLLS